MSLVLPLLVLPLIALLFWEGCLVFPLTVLSSILSIFSPILETLPTLVTPPG